MTLIELLDLAHAVRIDNADERDFRGNHATAFARAVIELLGETQPCGFEPPVAEPGLVSILDGSDDPQPAYQFTPAEARWFAAELLRAADVAEVPCG